MVPAHNCFPFSPIIMQCKTRPPPPLMSPECFLSILGLKSQRSQCIDFWKWFQTHIKCFLFTPIFMKLYTQTSHESRMSTLDFGVKVTVHWLLKIMVSVMVSGNVYLLSFYMYCHETLYSLPMSQVFSSGQKVTGQGHSPLITEHGFRRITGLPFHLSSWNFTHTHTLPMSQGCACTIDCGAKGSKVEITVHWLLKNVLGT